MSIVNKVFVEIIWFLTYTLCISQQIILFTKLNNNYKKLKTTWYIIQHTSSSCTFVLY